MNHANGGGGEKLKRGIARRHAVEAVRRGRGEAERVRHRRAVERERAAGERARAERRMCEARASVGKTRGVARKHLFKREPVVREPHRLRALQVRVTGQHRARVLGGACEQHRAQLKQPRARGERGVAQIQREVGGDLVVAAAPGVQAPGGVANFFAQPRFNVHVDVFERRVKTKRAALDFARNFAQPRDDARHVRRRHQPLRAEHPRVGDGAAQVVPRERAVEGDARAERFHARVGGGGEASAPRLLGCATGVHPATLTAARASCKLAGGGGDGVGSVGVPIYIGRDGDGDGDGVGVADGDGDAGLAVAAHAHTTC